MVLTYRVDDEVVVLSNIGGLLNNPRHFDALADVNEMLGEGYRMFVLEMRGLRELGSTALGLLTTLTRAIRQHGGEVVLAGLSPGTERFLDDMKMDSYWEIFDGVDQAREYFRHPER